MRRRWAGSSTLGALICAFAASAQAQAFSDQTAAMGVAFVHQIPDPNEYLVMGAGGAWGDYDGDGDPDLYVGSQDGPNALFENPGDGGAFSDRAVAFGLDLPGDQTTGALFGDYDNDGDPDLYVMNRGDNRMLRNDGPGGPGWLFTDVTTEIGVASYGRTSAAVYADYDRDGWLDLYVVNHNFGTGPPQPGDPWREDHLFHNEAGPAGSRVFVDVAPALLDPAMLDSLGHSAAFLDYDNDADDDLYVANEDFGSDPTTYGNRMWRNYGTGDASGWLFGDATAETNTVLDNRHPMGIAIGDYNNDGWLDMFLSDAGANHLYRNQGAPGYTFNDIALVSGVARNPIPATGAFNVSWGVLFLDFDLDGWQDAYLANGVGNKTLEEEGKQPNPLFHNQADPPMNTFVELAVPGHVGDERNSRTVIKADYDRDGDEDIYVVNYNGQARLLRNEQTGGDWLTVRLIGRASNRDAIGARVKITTPSGPDQYRMVQSGSTTGGGNDLTLHFGVTGQPTVSSVEIDWPSGARQKLVDLAPNQRITIAEAVPGVPALGPWLGLLLGAGLAACAGLRRSP